MSSQYSTSALFFHHPFFSSSSSSPSKLITFSSDFLIGTKEKRTQNLELVSRCSAISTHRTQEYSDHVFQDGLSMTKWRETVEDDIDKAENQSLKVLKSNEIKEQIDTIKSMLISMEDGEITISPYDTAWVALVQDMNGAGSPQFPTSIQWIVNNQLPDGSWGDDLLFSSHDRLINTLACVVALTFWNIHQDKCQKGMAFFKENLWKLDNEKDEHMPIGFEVVFPSLLDMAKSLNIDVPDNSPVLEKIYLQRNLKLTKIPREILHNVPTTLLHSLEGMAGDLDWKKLLKLQCEDGSFLFSPASTAFALSQTKDQNCFEYLKNAVQKFKGGVPNVYPVDLFEHVWAVDRLERLGLSRYFKPEIKECLDYVYKYWTEDGICWARNTLVHDVDDTAMGFRLLRLHGYDVSADVFKIFEKGGEFFCFAGQSTHAVTGMYNLYRAAQVKLTGEDILESAKQFSTKFLREKQAANELFDKWIITKDLPGEVGYALDVPWFASLPRVETRLYIDQYGGDADVWIGKTLYRMPYVNNNIYLDLAKSDYNNCQALHLKEWSRMQKWYTECNLDRFGASRKDLLLAYFVASANIYEPERSLERMAWAKTAVLVEIISSYFKDSIHHCEDLISEFRNFITIPGYRGKSGGTGNGLTATLVGTLNQLSLDVLVAPGRDISQQLCHAWEKWLIKCHASDGDRHKAELLVQTINIIGGGHSFSEELFSHPQYRQLSVLTNNVCYQLNKKVQECNNGSGSYNIGREIQSEMEQLLQIVLENSEDGIDYNFKKTFLTVAKSFYYIAYCDSETVDFHISKVLFQRVE